MASRCRPLLLSVMILTACSRGGALPPTAAPGGGPGFAAGSGLTATIKIRVPNPMVGESVTSGLMHQAFVAASTQGALVKLYDHHKDRRPIASTAVSLTAKSHECKKTSHGRTCTVVIGIPSAGTYDFAIDTYDKPPKHGKFSATAKPLAVGFASDKFTRSRTIKVVLGGIVASTQTAFGLSTTPAIDPLSGAVTVAARDADDNVIVTDVYVDKRGRTVTLTMSAGSDAGTTVSFTPPSIDKPSPVTLTYAPASMSGTQATNGFSATLLATATNGATPIGPTVTFTKPALTFYTIPTGSSMPQHITTGPDGALWFTEENVNQIGRVTTTGSVQEFPATPSGSEPMAIVSGPDRNLWFTAQTGNTINRITTGGTVSSFTIPTANSYPEGIAVGSDGNLWFTESATASKIGRVSTSGTGFQEFSLASGAKPYGLTSDSDGALWFAQFGTNQIGRSPTAGSPITSYSSGQVTLPFVVAAGTDGSLWFGGCDNYIGSMTTGGTVSATYKLPGSGEVDDITVGPDGAIWFSVSTVPSETQLIGRVANGITTYYDLPGTNPYPTGITKGPDGAIWFLELNANQVGRLQ